MSRAQTPRASWGLPTAARADPDPAGRSAPWTWRTRFRWRGAGAFGPRSQPGQILLASIIQTLKLTDQQKKDEADLQKHVDEELGKMLTAKQKQRLKDIQQVSRPDGFGPGRRRRRGPGRPPGQDAAPSDRGPGGPPDGNGPPDGARRGPDGPPDGGRPDRGLAERGPGGPPPASAVLVLAARASVVLGDSVARRRRPAGSSPRPSSAN